MAEKEGKFLQDLATVLEADKPQGLKPDDELASAGKAPWDSMAIITVIGLADDTFGVVLSGAALAKCAKVGDVMALIAAEKEQ